MGGIQFPHTTDVTKQLWRWCVCRELYTFVHQITKLLMLSLDVYILIWNGSPRTGNYKNLVTQTLIFLLPESTKYVTDISWHRGPDCYAVDAFTVSWTKFYFYAFPPFSIILKGFTKDHSRSGNGHYGYPSGRPNHGTHCSKSFCHLIHLYSNLTII